MEGSFYLLDPAAFQRQLGDDFAWAVDTCPFFECSDSDLTEAYFFRWRTYR